MPPRPVKVDPPKPSFAQRFPFIAQTAKAATTPHLIIEARAGTGKTTTLIEGLKVCRGLKPLITPSTQQQAIWNAMQKGGDGGKACFVAFNYNIAEELKKRVPLGCEARTLHSLGYKIVRNSFKLFGPGGGVHETRVTDILVRLIGGEGVNAEDVTNQYKDTMRLTRQVVGLCKMELLKGTSEDVSNLIGHYDLDTDDADMIYVNELVPQVLMECKNVLKDGCIDLNDQIWLPVILNLRIDPFDTFVVDEGQDLNRCQHELIKRCGQRLIVCGDPKQAIFSFAGADSRSMERLTEELKNTKQGCEHLYLTVTRRCGKRIVEEAQRIVPDIEVEDDAHRGMILYAHLSVNSKEEEYGQEGPMYYEMVKEGDFVLCRYNAPLVRESMRLTRLGIKNTIQGKDAGTALINLIKKLCRPSKPERMSKDSLVIEVEYWYKKEVDKEQKKKNPSAQKLITLRDKTDSVLHLFSPENVKTAYDVICKIDPMFDDDKDSKGVRLMTIHKSKGLEAHRVFLIETEPHPSVTLPWQLEAEKNLRYVAITRAISELVYVS